MVGGDFQKSLQLFVAYGYYVFEDGVCVDPSNVLNGRPNYANITFSELFAGPSVDRPEVMDEGPDYATALLSKFCTGARCPPCVGARCPPPPPPCWRLLGLRQLRCKVERKGDFRRDNAYSSLSLFPPSSSSSSFYLFFFFFIFHLFHF